MTETAKIVAPSFFTRLESSSGLVGAAAKFVRRATRSLWYRGSTLVRVLGPSNVRRNLLFPIRNIVLRSRPLTVKAGGECYLLIPEGAVPLEMWSKQYFEAHELKFVLGLLKPGMTFLDAGANVGLFTIPAGKKVQPGKVYAFEPSSWTLDRLRRNIELNKVTNVSLAQCALGEAEGEATLQLNARGKDGLNTIGKPTHEFSEVVATERVRVKTVDEVVRDCGIERVDVMKVDVEGAELLVFRGAAKLLARGDAPLIMYESQYLTKGFGYDAAESRELLSRHGYSFFLIDARSGKITEMPQGDIGDAMVIAVKPGHGLFAAVREMVQVTPPRYINEMAR